MFVGLLTALVVIRLGSPSPLAPLPPPPPPPTDALAWLEEPSRQYVAVVDVFDGQRWLRALHGRAAVSVTTWRPARRSAKGSAPGWLEGAPAYVLAATGHRRLLNFITTDSKGAVDIFVDDGDEVTKHSRNLRLDSLANTVVAVSSRPSRRTGASLPAQQSTELLASLWYEHRTFRSLLLHEVRPGAWERLHLDILKSWKYDARADVGYRRFAAVVSVPPNKPPAWLSALIGRRAYDMNGCPSHIIWSPSYLSYSVDLRKYGRHGYTLGRNRRLIVEITRSINSTNTLRTFWRGRLSPVALKTTLLRGEAELATEYLTMQNISLSVYHYMPGAVEMCPNMILVPRAGPLQHWSLLLRALPWRVWVSIAASALLYALGWKIVSGRTFTGSVGFALAVFSSRGGSSEQGASSTPQRIMLAAALLASVTVVAIYQGRLYMITIQPEYFPEMETLEEMADQGIVFRATSLDNQTVTHWFSRDSNPDPDLWPRIKRRAVIGANLHTSKRLNATDAYLVPYYFWNNVQSYWPFAKQTHHPLSGYYGVKYYGIPSRLNSPWRDILNIRVLRAKAGGLTNIWEHRATVDYGFNLRGSQYEYDGPTLLTNVELRVLSLADLWPHLQVLGLGLLLAALAFAKERWSNTNIPHLTRECSWLCKSAEIPSGYRDN